MTIGWGGFGKPAGAGLLTVAFALLVLVGCGAGGGGDDSMPAATDAADSAPAIPTPTPVVITLSDVVWTTAVDPQTREPRDEVTSFATTAPVIIAAVKVGSLPASAQLTARWSIDGVEVPEATMQAATERALKEGWATFQFTRDEGQHFPLGVLEVRITASAGAEVTGSVRIVLP